MSLLQSNLVIGCWMIASVGCSFDSAPETGGRTDGMSAPGWQPPGAAHAGASGSELAQDASSSTMSARSGSGGTASTSADGRSMRPGAAMTGASPDQGQKNPDADLDAGPMQARDAGSPVSEPAPQQQPPPPDASTPAPVRCRPGVYTGTFNGSIELIGLSLGPVTGTVRANLVADDTAEHLELRDGRVMGVDQDGNRLTCGLVGRVNCADFSFSDGRLVEGNFHNVGSNSDTAFTGSAQAMYSQEPHSVIGTWQVEATDTSLLGGKGTWTLVWSQ